MKEEALNKFNTKEVIALRFYYEIKAVKSH